MRQLFKLLLAALLLAAVAVGLGLQAYHAFTQEELAAIVRCEPAPPGLSYPFLMQVTPVHNGQPGRPEKFPMTGEQWAIGGEILKWSPWLNFLGLKSRYKLTRLSSRYWTAADEMSKPRAVYDLEGGTPAPWRWLHRFGCRLPLVDAVYGSTVYTPVRLNREWKVVVNHSGFLVRLSREEIPL